MNKLETKRKLTSLNEMFGMPSDDLAVNPLSKIQLNPNQKDTVSDWDQDIQALPILPIEALKPRKNHKFQINLGKKNEDLLQSIREFGVLEPIIVRPIQESRNGDMQMYEILAGHRRSTMAKEAGLTEIPVRILEGLTEDEADLIETETNLLQRSWKDMSHSERAAVLYAHYNAIHNKGIRKGFLEEINAEIQTLASPVESTSESGLSPVATRGNLRQSGEEYELSKDTVARYLRIYTLIDELKERMDLDEISLRAGVDLSYLTPEHQKELDQLLEYGYKIDAKKAEEMRRREGKGELNTNCMRGILSGVIPERKPGRPKSYKIKDSIIKKYFKEGTKANEIESVIDAALEAYFKKTSK